MVIDTSVLIAILIAEDDRRSLLQKMNTASRLVMSAASVVEAGAVLMNHGAGDFEHLLDPFLGRAGIEVVPVDRVQASIARDGYRRFGRGRHQAALNLGDCFSYGLAMAMGEPLLFKGNDFSLTDVLVA